jgi:hypothetical protein
MRKTGFGLSDGRDIFQRRERYTGFVDVASPMCEFAPARHAGFFDYQTACAR